MPKIIETIIRVRGDVNVGGLGNLGGSLGQASRGTQTLGESLRGLSPTMQAFRTGVGTSTRSLSQLNSILVRGAAGVIAFAGAVRLAGSVLESFGNIQLILDRIDLFSDGTVKATDRLDQLFTLAQNNSAPLQTTGDLFVKMTRAMGEMEDAGGKALLVTDTLTKLMRISGTSATEASAGLLQFAQGLSSASLSGDELKSVTENLPALAQILTKALGVSIKGLKDLGADGLLTKDIIINALIDSKDAVDAQAEALSKTFSQALTAVASAFDFYIFKSEEVAGINEFAISTLEDMTRNMASLIDQIILAGKALVLAFGPVIVRTLVALTGTLVNMMAASIAAGPSIAAVRASVVALAREQQVLARENVRKAITERRAAEAAVLHARANRAVGLSSVAEARALAALEAALRRTTLASQDLALANARLSQSQGAGAMIGAGASKAVGYISILGLVGLAVDEVAKSVFGIEGVLSGVFETIGSIFTTLGLNLSAVGSGISALNSLLLGNLKEAGKALDESKAKFKASVDEITSPLKSLKRVTDDVRDSQVALKESNDKIPKSLESVIKSTDQLSESIKSISDAQIKRVLDPNALAELKTDLKEGGEQVERFTNKFLRSVDTQTDLVTKQFEDRKDLSQRVLDSMADNENNLSKSLQKTFRNTLKTLIGVNNDRVKHHEKTLAEIIRFENVLKTEAERLIKDVARAAERAAGIRTGALDRLADAEKRHLENIIASEEADRVAKAAAQSRLDELAKETGRTYEQVEDGLSQLLDRIRSLSSSASELGASAAQAEFEALTSEFKDLDSVLGDIISESFDVDKAKPLADQINTIGDALAATADDIAQVAKVERDNGLDQLERSADGLRQTISETKEDTEQLGLRLQRNLQGSVELERRDLDAAIAETIRLRERLQQLSGRVTVDTSELDILEGRLNAPLIQQVRVVGEVQTSIPAQKTSELPFNKLKSSAVQAKREVGRLRDETTRLSKVVKSGLKGRIKIDRKQLDDAVKTSDTLIDALKNVEGAIFLDTSQLEELRRRVAEPLRQQVIIDTIIGSGGTPSSPSGDGSFIDDGGILNRPGGFSLAGGDRLGDSSAEGIFSLAGGDRLKRLTANSLDEAEDIINRQTPFDINAIIRLEALEAQDQLDEFVDSARRSLLGFDFSFDFDAFVDDFKESLGEQAGIIDNTVASSGAALRHGADLFRGTVQTFRSSAQTVEEATDRVRAGFQNNVLDLAAANDTAIARIMGEADRNIQEIIQRTGEATKNAMAASERNVENIINAYKDSIQSIGGTSEAFLRSVDDLERNLLQSGSTDEEIRVDNIRRLHQTLSDARAAAAEGDIEEARRLSDLAVQLVADISQETQDSFGNVVLSETEAAQQGLQFIDDIRNLNATIDQEAISAEQAQTQTELDNEQAVLDETINNIRSEADAEIAAINEVRETRIQAQAIAHDQALAHIEEQRDAALASIQAQVDASRGIQRPGGSGNNLGNQGPIGTQDDPLIISYGGSPSEAFNTIGRDIPLRPRPTTVGQVISQLNPTTNTNTGPTPIDSALAFYNQGVLGGGRGSAFTNSGSGTQNINTGSGSQTPSTPVDSALAFYNQGVLGGGRAGKRLPGSTDPVLEAITGAGQEIQNMFDQLGSTAANSPFFEGATSFDASPFFDAAQTVLQEMGHSAEDALRIIKEFTQSDAQIRDDVMDDIFDEMGVNIVSINGTLHNFDAELAQIILNLEPLTELDIPTDAEKTAAAQAAAAANPDIMIRFQSGDDAPVRGRFPDTAETSRFLNSLQQNNRLARG